MILQVFTFQYFGRRRVPDGADPPPLRDEGVVGDEDHGALLDRRRRSSARARFAPTTATSTGLRLDVRSQALSDRRSSLGPRALGAGGRAGAPAPQRGVLGRASTGTRTLDAGRLGGAGVEVSARRRLELAAGGVELLDQEPRRAAARRRSSPAARAPRRSRLERGRARRAAARRPDSSASPGRTGRRRPRSCWASCSGLPWPRERRPRAVRPRRARSSRGDVGRLRALELPARGHPHELRAARSPCSSTSSRTTSTATARSSAYRAREARGSSRTRARRRRGRAAWLRRRRCRRGASSSRAERSAPGRAADPRRAQPRERRRRDRCGRARSGVADERIAEALRTFPACRTASRTCASSAASASSTTRRRRTSAAAAARLALVRRAAAT